MILHPLAESIAQRNADMVSYPIMAVLSIALTAALVCARIRGLLTRREFARQHGCRPVAKAFNKEPIFGLDTIPATLCALRQHKILQQGCELFREYGNTFTLQELHRRAIVTVEPENIKTLLSLKFCDYGIDHRLEAFKPLLGEGIFDSDGEH